jgi:hypothetical protein
MCSEQSELLPNPYFIRVIKRYDPESHRLSKQPFARFPSAVETVEKLLLLLDFSTVSTARHFHNESLGIRSSAVKPGKRGKREGRMSSRQG